MVQSRQFTKSNEMNYLLTPLVLHNYECIFFCFDFSFRNAPEYSL